MDNGVEDGSTPIRSSRKFRKNFPPKIIECSWVSICGATHSRNQDAVFANFPFFAVADGVGGGSSGELASSKILEFCEAIPKTVWKNTKELQARLIESDSVISSELAKVTIGPSATTFAGLWLRGFNSALIAHVGDVRVLSLFETNSTYEIRQLTQDQTYGNLEESPPLGGSLADPARMIGVGAIGEPSVETIKIAEKELILICSDGLHKFLSPDEIVRICCPILKAGNALTIVAQALVHEAIKNGSYDDISILILRKNPRFGVRQSLWLSLAISLILLAVDLWIGWFSLAIEI